MKINLVLSTTFLMVTCSPSPSSNPPLAVYVSKLLESPTQNGKSTLSSLRMGSTFADSLEKNTGISESSQNKSDTSTLSFAPGTSLLRKRRDTTMASCINSFKKLKDKYFGLIATEITNGNPEAAVKLLTPVADILPLSELVEMSYNLTNIPKILRFSYKLPYCSQDRIVITTLLKVIREQNHQRAPEMLQFALGLTSCTSTLADLIIEAKQIATSALGVKIRWGANADVYNFMNATGLNYRIYLKDIIISAYDNSESSADAVLEFIKGLPHFEQQVVAYPILFEELMRSNGFDTQGIPVLIYRAKRLPLSTGGSTELEKTRLQNMISSIPTGLRSLLFDSVTWIRAKVSSAYLGFLAAQIFACPLSHVGFDRGWDTTRLSDGRYFTFTSTGSSDIRNKGKKLMSTTSGAIEDIGGSETQYQWEVIPTGNASYFYFKNRHNNRMLKGWSSECGPVTTDNFSSGSSNLFWSIS